MQKKHSALSKQRPILSLFNLTMITIVAVASIRNLPVAALFGSQLIFFFALAALFFFIPSALVSAELASRWPKQGGIYIWVKQAFGKQLGFLAIWFWWIENVIWYPTILSFIAGTLGYFIHPVLADNKYFLIAVILSAFWGSTMINLLGIRTVSLFTNVCTLLGLLVPFVLIVSLGITWFFSGGNIHIEFTATSMLPAMNNSNTWVALTGIMLSLCGIEIATVHANDSRNPQQTFPKAVLLSALLIFCILAFGALTIAMVLPSQEISFVAGIMQVFHAFFAVYHMTWLLPIIAVMIVLGALGSMNNWIIAPTTALLTAAQDGHLSQPLQRVNRHHAPIALLIYQALIVSFLSLAYFLIPSVNGTYWLFTALAVQFYMFVYLLIFSAGIYLRLKSPIKKQAFKIPGGRYAGMLLTASLGIIGCLITIAVSFIAPDNIDVGSSLRYQLLLVTGLIIMCAPPVLLFYYRKKSIPKSSFLLVDE